MEKRLNTCPVSRFRKAIGSRGCVAKRRQSVKLSPDGFPLRKCIRNFAECRLDRLLITGKRDIAARLRIAKIAFGDRKSVVWGKSVSVGDELGGSRIIKKKNK